MRKSVVGVVMLGGFLMLAIWWAQVFDTRAEIVPRPTTIEGRYAHYDYRILELSSRERSASFQPALRVDDAVVVGALQELMRSVYGDSVESLAQPIVETRLEKNYVTFGAVNAKTYFELFRNDKGEVGSVTFWREPIK